MYGRWYVGRNIGKVGNTLYYSKIEALEYIKEGQILTHYYTPQKYTAYIYKCKELQYIMRNIIYKG